MHVCIMNYRNNGEAILASVVAGKSDKWYIKNNAVDILKLKEWRKTMSEYDKVCIETFLRDQLKLFPEKVAETPEEAEDFLDMCMAAVCKNMKEVREYFDETGADISGMSKEELEQADEVFKLPDGRYLVVDA